MIFALDVFRPELTDEVVSMKTPPLSALLERNMDGLQAVEVSVARPLLLYSQVLL